MDEMQNVVFVTPPMPESELVMILRGMIAELQQENTALRFDLAARDAYARGSDEESYALRQKARELREWQRLPVRLGA